MNFASDWVNSKIFLLVEDLGELVGGFEVFFEVFFGYGGGDN